MKSYGHELIMDLHSCSTDRMTQDGVKEYCEQICEMTGMNPEEFHIWASNPADREETPNHLYGVSAVQFITTSSLVIHTLPKMHRVYANLFSCGELDSKALLHFTRKYWNCGILAGSTLIVRS